MFLEKQTDFWILVDRARILLLFLNNIAGTKKKNKIETERKENVVALVQYRLKRGTFVSVYVPECICVFSHVTKRDQEKSTYTDKRHFSLDTDYFDQLEFGVDLCVRQPLM